MKKLLITASLGGLLFASNIEIPIAFKANFLQQVKNPKGKIIKYRGKIYFNSPDNTKWIYNSPTRKEVCSSDGKVIVIDHELEQASYYSIDKRLNLSKILRRAKHHKGNIYTTKYKGKLYTIVVNSKNQVNQIAYKDNLDNTVNIMFRNIKYRNTPFPNSKFFCARPNGYDSIY
jgi:outer membrane lipoprotein-sorting protein